MTDRRQFLKGLAGIGTLATIDGDGAIALFGDLGEVSSDGYDEACAGIAMVSIADRRGFIRVPR